SRRLRFRLRLLHFRWRRSRSFPRRRILEREDGDLLVSDRLGLGVRFRRRQRTRLRRFLDWFVDHRLPAELRLTRLFQFPFAAPLTPRAPSIPEPVKRN